MKKVLLCLLLVLVLVLIMAPVALADGAGDNSPVVMDLTVLFSIVTAFITVNVVGLLTRCTWRSGWKILVCVIVSGALGFGQLWVTGNTVWSLGNWLPIATAVFGAAYIWYKAIAWKVPGLKGWWERHGLKPAVGK